MARGKRDLAVVLTLWHTGLRVAKLCDLRPTDVELGERKGTVTVRAGNGGKYRVALLDIAARNARTAYLAVRPLGRAYVHRLAAARRRRGAGGALTDGNDGDLSHPSDRDLEQDVARLEVDAV